LICNRINQESNHNLRLGALITISQSAHIYDDTWESVEAIVNQHYLGNKSVSFADPCGNFLVEIEDRNILVSQTNPGDGEIVKVYKGKHPLNLIRDIARNSPALSPDHSGYLGIELQKAYYAIINGLAYTQDD
jgi:thymidylate synthase